MSDKGTTLLMKSELFTDLRQSPWKAAGTDALMQYTAREALEAMGGYQIEERTIQTIDGIMIPNQKAIVRTSAGGDSSHPLVFSIVPSDHRIIQPFEMADYWDEFVNRPLSAIGIGKGGRDLFFATTTKDINVRGEILEPTLFLNVSMAGERPMWLKQAFISMFCTNQVESLMRNAYESHKILHRNDLKVQIKSVLNGVVDRAELKALHTQEQFVALSERTINQPESMTIFQAAYPVGHPPSPEGKSAKAYTEAVETYETKRAAQLEMQEVCSALFDGVGMGSREPSRLGTAWGAYNSVAEAVDHVNKIKTSPEAKLLSSMVGVRAAIKERAFEAACTLIQ